MKSLIQAVVLVMVAFIVSTMLPGCAMLNDASQPRELARCEIPVTRTDAMGIKHADCAYWVIGRYRK